ncbi:MAG: DNA translocase FtsK [Acidimicrobiaceae bacterium]|nr:DNA translocase FtsK [Acidimicrobiaceae bacterium]
MATARHQSKPGGKTAKRPPSRARGGSRGSSVPTIWQRHARDLLVVVFIVAGFFATLAEVGALGPVGRAISTLLQVVFGAGRFVLPFILVGLGGALLWGKIDVDPIRLGWGISLALLSVCGLSDLAGGRPGWHASTAQLAHGGGWVGVLIGGGLHKAVGVAGSAILLLAVLVVAIMVGTGIGLRSLLSAAAVVVRWTASHFSRWWTSRPESQSALRGVPARVEQTKGPSARSTRGASDEDSQDYSSPPEDEEQSYADYTQEYDVLSDPIEQVIAPTKGTPTPVVNVAQMSGDWELPPASLLARTRELRQDRSVIEALGVELVNALAAHGVDTILVGFTVGPTVTRFELELGPGVKVASVTSLNKDIAYAMASPEVRILAPIPGRSAIGVEVPNRQRTLVALGDLLASDEALAAHHPLDVPIGRDISGKTVVVNLGEMPHVLISGATGAGKSSCINSMVTSLVMRATPEQLRLLLVDPKRVEMGQYNDLPHLLAPVVVDPKKAAGMLAWAVKEMERRYDLLAESGARDITSYQQMIVRGELVAEASTAQLVADAIERAIGLESDAATPPGPEQLPYIVIVVDELNDLMMVAARDVEESVVRIAQMARAVGIHLVLATQRPSVDVITGVIKANVPSRIAFAVSSLADSRVILDQAGAERLIGKGDMLLVTASSNIARRLQGPWVSEEEVHRVVASWRAQGGRRENVVALDVPTSRSGSMGGSSGDDDDEILRQARDLVIRTQSGSTSMLQRKLRVGFARAGRIMDQLEQEGVVAAGDGSKARKVLITLEEYDEQTSL